MYNTSNLVITSDFLRLDLPQHEVENLPKKLPKELSVRILTSIISDFSILKTKREVDQKWIPLITNTSLRDRLHVASSTGAILLAPQVVFTALRRVLTHGEHSEDSPISPIDNIVLLIAYTAQQMLDHDRANASKDSEAFKDKAASHLLSNSIFNTDLEYLSVLFEYDEIWDQDFTTDQPLLSTVGKNPSALYEKAKGIPLEYLLDVAFYLEDQVLTQRRSQKNSLNSTTFDTRSLRQEMSNNVGHLRAFDMLTKNADDYCKLPISSILEGWNFDDIRRHPIISFDNASFSVSCLSYLLKRTAGRILLFDLEDCLNSLDTINTKQAIVEIHQFAQSRHESMIGSLLRRIFKKRSSTIVTEEEMVEAAHKAYPNSRLPKVCDFAVRYESVVLVCDATYRVPPRKVQFNRGSINEARKEVSRTITGRKIQQLWSTIRIIQSGLFSDLLGDTKDCTFIPIVIPSSGGMPWTPIVRRLVEENISNSDEDKPVGTLPPCLASPSDLLMLERYGDFMGPDCINLLLRWRTGQHRDWSFIQFLLLENMVAKFPRHSVRIQRRIVNESRYRIRKNN